MRTVSVRLPESFDEYMRRTVGDRRPINDEARGAFIAGMVMAAVHNNGHRALAKEIAKLYADARSVH